MQKNNYTTLIVVVLVIAVALFFIFRNKKAVVSPVVTPVDTTENEQQSVQDTSGVTGVGAVSIAYRDALIKYADRRIQLDKDCQAYPNSVTYKDHTGIMIDNRSPQTQTVKIGTTFSIKPYGFKIVVLPDIYLKSKTILVDCNNRQNVATILVQE